MIYKNIERNVLASLSLSGRSELNDPFKRIDISPSFWGPSGWIFIDSIIEAFPDSANNEERNKMYAFMVSLQLLLPCQRCRHNYKRFMIDHPPERYISGKYYVKQWFNMYRNLKN